MTTKKKIWFINSNEYTLSSMANQLEVFTINNGTLPDLILMSQSAFNNYVRLMKLPGMERVKLDKLTFHGVKIAQEDY